MVALETPRSRNIPPLQIGTQYVRHGNIGQIPAKRMARQLWFNSAIRDDSQL
jgi:hypothetical protein